MERRDKFTASMVKRKNVKKCEAEGMVADSTEVRVALMDKFHSGECTLEEVQKELAKIKRNAKKNGQITKSQAFNQG